MIFENFPFPKRLRHLSRPTMLMGLTVFLLPPLTLYLPLSLAVLLPVLVLFAIVGRVVSGTPRFRIDYLSTIVLAALMFAAAASAGWSFSAELTWDKLPRTAMIGGLGILFIAAMSGVDALQAQTLSKAFAGGILAVSVLIVIQRVTGEILIRADLYQITLNSFLNTFNRPLSILSIMVWPAVVILAEKRPVYGISAVAICLALFATFQTGAATAAMAFGALVFACVYAAPRVMAPLTGAVLGLSVLLAPTIEHVLPQPKQMFEQYNLPRSAYHRLLVWQFTSAKIAERPLLGWGFNTSRAIPGGKDNVDVSEAALPLHPHNAALQWRLELGILGALIGAGLFVVAGVCARRYGRNRIAQAGATATMASAFCVGMLSFGAWQSWWLSGLFIIAGMAVLVCRNSEKPAPR